MPITQNIDASLKYRFFNADNVEVVGFGGEDIATRFRSHSVLAGITYNFGEPAAPTPPLPPPPHPPPPPPPPPPPAAAVCTPGPYLVFFAWRSDRRHVGSGCISTVGTR